MPKKSGLDPIYKKPLSLKELFGHTAKLWKKYQSSLLMVFFLYFIPLLVALAVIFREELAYGSERMGLLQYHALVLAFLQKVFSAALLLFVIAFFEKKIIRPDIFFRRLFYLLIPLLMTISMNFFFILSGLMLFIVPGIFAAFFFIFSDLLVFHENIFGFFALKESFRLVKSFWLRVFALTLLVELFSQGVEFALIILSGRFSWPRPEIQFFVTYLLIYFIKFFGFLFFAVFFYNLRQLMMPKNEIEKPAEDLD